MNETDDLGELAEARRPDSANGPPAPWQPPRPRTARIRGSTIDSSCWRTRFNFPLMGSHSFVVMSQLAVASVLPSGEKATSWTELLGCAWITRFFFPDLASKRVTSGPNPAQAKKLQTERDARMAQQRARGLQRPPRQ